jgi:hypothetical protein
MMFVERSSEGFPDPRLISDRGSNLAAPPEELEQCAFAGGEPDDVARPRQLCDSGS